MSRFPSGGWLGLRLSSMDIRVDGKAALVTGASRGIGLAIAKAVVDSGGKVCITARKQYELEEALATLGSDAIAVAGGVDDRDHAEAAIATCIAEFGSLDILVNNAATNPQFGPLIQADPAAISKIFRVNLEAPITWSQIAYSAWMREHGGVVLNVASIGGIKAEPMIGAYNVSKAALIHLTEQLAAELAPAVRVNALAPGLVKTKFARALWEPNEEGVAKRIPLKRLGTPEDIGTAALYLVSDAASWVTGSTLVIDGGALLGGFV